MFWALCFLSPCSWDSAGEDAGARRAKRVWGMQRPHTASSGAMLLFEVESKKRRYRSEVGGVTTLSQHATLSRVMENADISVQTFLWWGKHLKRLSCPQNVSHEMLEIVCVWVWERVHQFTCLSAVFKASISGIGWFCFFLNQN